MEGIAIHNHQLEGGSCNDGRISRMIACQGCFAKHIALGQDGQGLIASKNDGFTFGDKVDLVPDIALLEHGFSRLKVFAMNALSREELELRNIPGQENIQNQIDDEP